MTIGIPHDPWPARRGGTGVLRRYRTMVEFKANPRDEAYLRALFAERYPAGRLGTLDDVARAERVVLVYPDAIGVGWGPMERRVRERARQGTELRVLNGRRRDFALDGRTRRHLHLRRILETSLAGEALATVLFLLATGPLLAADLLRGRR
jgi:hypothetical protein